MRQNMARKSVAHEMIEIVDVPLAARRSSCELSPIFSLSPLPPSYVQPVKTVCGDASNNLAVSYATPVTACNRNRYLAAPPAARMSKGEVVSTRQVSRDELMGKGQLT